MDLSLIQGTISGLKVAGDIAKGFMELKSMAEVQGKVIELQGVILSAQSSALSANADQAAMVDEVRSLHAELSRMKAWEAQRQRYQLVGIWSGTGLVYALKESASQGEPPHWLCTKCYEDGLRMILQPRQNKDGWCYIACPTCKSEIHSRYRAVSGAKYAEAADA